MAETSKDLKIQKGSGLWNEETIKAYTTQQEIAGDDAGVRIEMDEGVCFIPCVEISNPRASSARVQTPNGIKALAFEKSIKHIDVVSATAEFAWNIQATDKLYLPEINFTSGVSPTLTLYCPNRNYGGWSNFRIRLLDSSGSDITTRIDPSSTISVWFRHTMRFPTDLTGTYNFHWMLDSYSWGSVGSYTEKNNIGKSSQLIYNMSDNLTFGAWAGGGINVTVTTQIQRVEVQGRQIPVNGIAYNFKPR